MKPLYDPVEAGVDSEGWQFLVTLGTYDLYLSPSNVALVQYGPQTSNYWTYYGDGTGCGEAIPAQPLTEEQYMVFLMAGGFRHD